MDHGPRTTDDELRSAGFSRLPSPVVACGFLGARAAWPAPRPPERRFSWTADISDVPIAVGPPDRRFSWTADILVGSGPPTLAMYPSPSAPDLLRNVSPATPLLHSPHFARFTAARSSAPEPTGMSAVHHVALARARTAHLAPYISSPCTLSIPATSPSRVIGSVYRTILGSDNATLLVDHRLHGAGARVLLHGDGIIVVLKLHDLRAIESPHRLMRAWRPAPHRVASHPDAGQAARAPSSRLTG